MAYITDLGAGQHLWIESRDRLTILTLLSASAGQQQSQRMSVETGAWAAPPQAFRTANGVVVQVETENGSRFLQVQGSQMQSLNGVPVLSEAEVLPMQETTEDPMQPMQPMEPMKPMQPMEPMKPMNPMPPMNSGQPLQMGELKMGDMEMRLNPMQMKMGSLEMRMGSAESQPQQRFCTQCGGEVQMGDRFCAQCGHRLGELSHS